MVQETAKEGLDMVVYICHANACKWREKEYCKFKDNLGNISRHYLKKDPLTLSKNIKLNQLKKKEKTKTKWKTNPQIKNNKKKPKQKQKQNKTKKKPQKTNNNNKKKPTKTQSLSFVRS